MYGRGYQTGGFGPPFTPPIVKQLLIAIAVVFVVQLVVPGVSEVFSVRPYQVWQQGFLWQPFTYMWLHSPYGLLHIGLNALVLWMFGSQLAMAWGAKRFLKYYLVCGIGAGFIISAIPYVMYGFGMGAYEAIGYRTLGASGAIYGLMLAYSLTWPDRTVALIFPPVTFRAIWLIPIVFFTTLLFGGGNISHVGHLGGLLVGWIYMRRSGDLRTSTISLDQLKYRWRRYRMRQKLRAIQYEEFERRRDDDKRMH